MLIMLIMRATITILLFVLTLSFHVMPRYRLDISYDGLAFHGWQSQSDGLTVQDVVARALETVTRTSSCLVYGSGRTDQGVHALMQVAHVDIPSAIPLRHLLYGVNAVVRPHPVQIQRVMQVPDSFHARFDAIMRVYRYVLTDAPVLPLFWHHRAWHWYKSPLNIEAMRAAAVLFHGRHDFSGFRSAQCQSHRPVRTIDALTITPLDLWTPMTMTRREDLRHPPLNDPPLNNPPATLMPATLMPATLMNELNGLNGLDETHLERPVIEAIPLETTSKKEASSWRENDLVHNNGSRDANHVKMWMVEVRARAFLHRQVRMMVGALVGVGSGRIAIDEIASALRNARPLEHALVAPPHGLYLYHIAYPGEPLPAPLTLSMK